MIKDTLAKIEEQLKQNAASKNSQNIELQNLFTKLQNEVDELSVKHGKHEDFATLKNLSSSVESFEITHPQFVAILNNITNILANMGI